MFAHTVRHVAAMALPALLVLTAPVLLTGCGGGQAGAGVGVAYVPYDEDFGEGFWGDEGSFGFGDEDEFGDEDGGGFGRDIQRRATGAAGGSVDLRASPRLEYVDVHQGEGPTARGGDTVDISYTIWLTTGKKLTSSEDKGQALRLTIGRSRAFSGWDTGLVGLAPGGVRRFHLSPEAVAKSGVGRALGPIPSEAGLIAEVELLAVRRAVRE